MHHLWCACAGELLFGPLEHSRVLGILHTPSYTLALFYGFEPANAKLPLVDSFATDA